MADERLLAVIRSWDQSTRSEQKQCLKGANLSMADLSKAVLNDANLVGANLTMATLNNAELNRANLTGVNLTGANLNETSFIDAELNNVDLTGAKLIGSKLIGAHLHNSKLDGANLTEAQLDKAFLGEASLKGSNLTGASLRNANLNRAMLNSVILKEAKLSGAKFNEAYLNNAILTRSDLSSAEFNETKFGNTNLNDSRGLNSCRHYGPSTIDHRTIQMSGNLPSEFLLGLGYADWQIEDAKMLQPNLTREQITDICYEVIRLRCTQPIQLFSPFISYSHQDEDFASQLYSELQASGVRCWYAPEDMKIGDRIRTRIDEAIHLKDKLILVLSEKSIESRWVESEVETALEKEQQTGTSMLFPIKLDDSIETTSFGWAATVRRSRHIGDFRNWKDSDFFSRSFEKVLRDLRA